MRGFFCFFKTDGQLNQTLFKIASLDKIIALSVEPSLNQKHSPLLVALKLLCWLLDQCYVRRKAMAIQATHH